MLIRYSYTCGGVGHMSRDCVQGSKCYNCSGVVRVTYLRCGFVLIVFCLRVTLAGTVLSLRSGPVTRVDPKGRFPPCQVTLSPTPIFADISPGIVPQTAPLLDCPRL
ncbi:hypothetical protein ARMSODRAFT_57244 [Armillaria solidipes]|uniref:CCHC-type domain-containing protein n=1 Tax=Armillaria solidipes TaxID=1076256 RepID=A0A2H3CBX2_9AGAR|nr:hypothetical protein ARMSODRAFT_57244 [Armillaria solidipes]